MRREEGKGRIVEHRRRAGETCIPAVKHGRYRWILRLVTPVCRPAAWLALRPLRSAAAAAARPGSRAAQRRGGGVSTSARGRARCRCRGPSARRAAPRPPAPASERATVGRSAGGRVRGRVGSRTWRVEVPQHMATQSVPLASLAALGSSRLAFMSHSTPNWRLQMASTSPCTVARSQSSCRQSSRRRASPARTNSARP